MAAAVLLQTVLATVLTLGLLTVALLSHPTVALVPAYQNPHGVASVRPDAARHSAVLVTALAAAPALLFDAAENINRQLTDGPEHALWPRLSASTALAIVLQLCGLLAATGRPGWRRLTGLLVAAFGYFGAAALLLPDHHGSWGVAGGVLAVLAASAYAATVARVGATAQRW